MESQFEENRLIECLNVLIKMAQWDKNLPFYFASLYQKPEQYKRALQLIRETPREAPVPPAPGDALIDDEWQKVFQLTTSSSRLHEVFEDARDPLAGAPPAMITVLAEVSDLTTDAKTIFYSRNGTFHLVFDAIRQQAKLNAMELIRDALHKFYTLFAANRNLAKQLNKLAGTNNWYSVLASLKDVRDYTSDEDASAKASLKEWNEKFTTELRATQLTPKDLFRLPKKLVRVAWDRQGLFQKALDSIPPETRLSGFELRQQISNVAYRLFSEEAKDELKSIEYDLQLLAVVARHYISVRKFAKLDGLVYAWPKVASLAMANYPNLEYVEDFFIERKQRPSEAELETRDARELYELCESNPALIRFLRLRPYFKDIDENELRRYRPLAPVTISDPAQPGTSKVVPSPSAATAATRAAPKISAPPRVYVLEILTTQPSVRTEKFNYKISMRTSSDDVIWSGQVNFSVRKLLDQMLYAIGATSEESLQSVLKELFSGTNAEQILVRAGTLLQRVIFQPGLESAFATAVEGAPSIRLVIASNEEQVQYLPWEWLLRPHHAELLLSDSRFSLVRSPPNWSEAAVPPLSLPIRLMGLFPNSPVGARNLSEASTQALETVASTGARYQPLAGNDATLDRLTSELDKFLPDIVHFEGYVDFKGAPSADSELFVLLSHETSTAPVNLSQFMSHLVAKDVQLMVIGRNEMGRIYGNAGPILANRLVKAKIPAVLAPIRYVDDVTATALTTEFYRSFLAGNTLEQALFTARRKVASRGGDWTSFALFANPAVLDLFQPLAVTA